MSSPTTASSHSGLVSCGQDFSSPFCITKTIEFSISGIMLIIITVILIQRVRIQRQLNFFVIISVEMMLTLLFNMLRSLIHDITIFYYLEVFFFDAYFITIVYSVSLRLINQANLNKKIKIALHSLYAGFIIINVAIIAYDALSDHDHCQQISYLIIDLLSILASIVLVISGLRYHQLQKKRLIGIHGEANIKNPLPFMWVWIIINVFCQIVNFMESLIFQFLDTNCHFSQDPAIDDSVKLLFTIFSYYTGMVATLIFFKQKYTRPVVVLRNSLRKDSADDENGNIQLMVQQITPHYTLNRNTTIE